MTEPTSQEPQDDDSSLIPAMLAAYAAYRSWRGSHSAVPSGWQQLAAALNLRKLLGTQLGMLGQRTLGRQGQEAGRPGGELWAGADAAVKAGVEAGVQTAAEGLLWMDKNTPKRQDPVTRQAAPASHPGPFLPTMDDPPTSLAHMTAAAVRNTVTASAAQGAGWEMKKWVSQHDNRVRSTHAALDGTVVAMKDVFVSPSGARLRWPGDPRAPIAERANCRCSLSVARR